MVRRNGTTVVGSTHMDFSAYVDRFPQPGETVVGRSFSTSPGGKGANQAVAVTRLAVEAHLISKVGTDYLGALLIDALRSEGVDTAHLNRDDRSATGTTLIYVDSLGENMIVVSPGTDLLVDPSDVDRAKAVLGGSAVVLTQLEIPQTTSNYALRLARTVGARTLLNPAPATPLAADLLKHVDVLTPNRIELETLTDVAVRRERDAIDASRTLVHQGVACVISTHGNQGALVVTDTESQRIPSLRVTVRDTVGAGDAFSGALAVALAKGADVFESAKFANLVAALKVTRRGAQRGLPTRKAVMAFAGHQGMQRLTDEILGR